MMYQDHLRTCGYCRNDLRTKKLAELGHMIRGTKAASSVTTTSTNSYLSDQVRKAKLRDLGRLIRGI
jgi:hypothetical protein